MKWHDINKEAPIEKMNDKYIKSPGHGTLHILVTHMKGNTKCVNEVIFANGKCILGNRTLKNTDIIAWTSLPDPCDDNMIN